MMKQDLLYFWIPLLFLFLFTYFLQNHIYVSNDVAYLVYIANQSLAGATYGIDFFETNPPMILYLYLPICLIYKILHVNIATIIMNYIFILAIVSTIISFFLLKKIIRPQDKAILYSLSFAFGCILLLLPANQFGQREHILMIFFLPYLFSTILALENKKMNATSAFLIGCFAGAGLAMKPFFLIPFFLIEVYAMIAKRNFLFSIRIETITIACVLLLYFISILILHPSYIYVMLPIIMDLYFESVKEPWIEVITTATLYYCAMAIVPIVLFKFDKHYQHLIMILLLAMLGMMLACLVPRTPWYYHMLPAYGFACVIWTYYLVKLTSMYLSHSTNKFTFILNKSCFLLLALVFYSMPLNDTLDLFAYYIHNKSYGPKKQLIQYVSSLAKHDTVSCFSFNTTDDCFPLVFYTHSQYGGRFPFFWWLRAILHYEHFPKQDTLPTTIAKDKEYVFNEMVKDLNHYKSDIVIINTENIGLLFDKRFNFIKYFSQDERFRHIWKNYRFIANVSHYQIYQYQAH